MNRRSLALAASVVGLAMALTVSPAALAGTRLNAGPAPSKNGVALARAGLSAASAAPTFRPHFVNSGADVCLQYSPVDFRCAHPASEPPPGVTVTSLMPGHDQSCGIRLDGSVLCWATGRTDTPYGAPPKPALTPPADLGPVAELSAGWRHMCALTVAQAVRCWGSNDYTDVDWGYQYGQTDVPEQARSQVVHISGSGVHTCALRVNGRVVCWGSNWYGQLNVPSGLSDVVSINASEGTCAVGIAGAVACWGGSGGNGVPADVGAASDARIGWQQQCALSPAGQIRCWGSTPWWAQWTALTFTVPEDVRSSVATSIATAADLSCAYLPDQDFGSKVRCWGLGSAVGAAQPRLNAIAAAKPTAVAALAGDRSAHVSWSSVTDGLSGDIHTAVASPGGQSCTTVELSCTVEGLSNREHYTFTVTATNAGGASEPSAPSNEVLPLVPGFQAWADDAVLPVGSATTVNIGQAAPNVVVTVTGALKAAVSTDASGLGTVAFTPAKSGVHKLTAAYTVKVGKKTSKYSANAQVYAPSATGPGKVKAGKTGKFSVTYAPPGAAVAVHLSDGRTLTATSDGTGKAAVSPIFGTIGPVTYTFSVSGVQVMAGGLTVTR